MPIEDTEVLVIGAGPTGLTTAIELARRGVRVRIIDAAAGPNTETRALGMQARTLELFEKVGTTDELLSRGLAVNEFEVLSEHERILRVDFGQLDTPYPFLLMIPQDQTQAVLTEHLAGLGVHIERRVELTSLVQDSGGVTVELAHADGSVETARTGWLVGADGAHSKVRDELGLGFLGTAFSENFAVADLRMDWDLPHTRFHAFLDRGDFVAYFPMREGWHRIAVAHRQGEVPEGDVTVEELQRAVERCGPPGARVAEVRQAGRFRINQRRVERHALGRVFLAGDAAHIHSVVGAQGMNTGIQDAFNLGWKLAMVVHERAHRGLLETYPAERAPVAERLVRGTRRITRMTLVRSALGTAFRRNVAPRVLGRQHVRQALARAISQIDVSYHDRRGAAPDHRMAVGDRVPDARPTDGNGTTPPRWSRSAHHSLRGRLVPRRPLDSLLTSPLHVFDALDPRTHTLLTFGVDRERVSRSLDEAGHADLVKVVAVDDPEIWRRYDVRHPAMLVVRPDGHLGLKAGAEDVAAVIGYFRDLTEREGVRA